MIGLDARSWIADRLSRYFRAVDEKDLERTLDLLDGVRLIQAGRALDEPTQRSAFYSEAYARDIGTAHLLSNLTVDQAGDVVEYWASYARYEYLNGTPELDRIGTCDGRIRHGESEPQWLEHSTRPTPARRN